MKNIILLLAVLLQNSAFVLDIDDKHENSCEIDGG
jgi:hypothetical protein